MIYCISYGGDNAPGIAKLYKEWTGKDFDKSMVVLNSHDIVAIDSVTKEKVGVAQLIMINDPYLGRTWGLVENVFVKENYRRRGVGTELMKAAEQEARLWGCEFIKLTSNLTRVAAHKLYEAMGYSKGYSYKKYIHKASILVAVAGAFDPLHEGHIDHLRKARGLGDRLVAIIGSDNFVAKNKGRKPYPLKTRMAVIEPWVDSIVVADGDDGTVADVLRVLTPKIFAKGKDRTKDNMPQEELVACDEIGCKVVYGVCGRFNSSTKLREGVTA